MGKVFFNFVEQSSVPTINIWDSPMEKILENASMSLDNNYWGKFIIGQDELVHGVDLKTGKLINLIEKGIVDPTNTLLTALDNALANTKLVLNTKYILHNEL